MLETILLDLVEFGDKYVVSGLVIVLLLVFVRWLFSENDTPDPWR
jgi:hypothetical protein